MGFSWRCDDENGKVVFWFQSSLHRLHAKSTPVLSGTFSKLASNHAGDAAGAVSHYQDSPWDYLESEGMIKRTKSVYLFLIYISELIFLNMFTASFLCVRMYDLESIFGILSGAQCESWGL